jgi:hypothetical protein
MLLYRNVAPEYIARLRVGGFFENSTIVELVKKNDYLSLTTATGDIYHIHRKNNSYNVFVNRKELRDKRQKKQAKHNGPEQLADNK